MEVVVIDVVRRFGLGAVAGCALAVIGCSETGTGNATNAATGCPPVCAPASGSGGAAGGIAGAAAGASRVTGVGGEDVPSPTMSGSGSAGGMTGSGAGGAAGAAAGTGGDGASGADAGGSGTGGGGGTGDAAGMVQALPPITDYTQAGPFTTTMESNTGPNGNYTMLRPDPLGADGFVHSPIIFGPGILTTPSLYVTLLTHLASHGFVTICVNSLTGGPNAPGRTSGSSGSASTPGRSRTSCKRPRGTAT